MKNPNKEQLTRFIAKELPNAEFDELNMREVREGNCSFEIVWNGKVIAESYEYCEYFSEKYYWSKIKNYLEWRFGVAKREKERELVNPNL